MTLTTENTGSLIQGAGLSVETVRVQIIRNTRVAGKKAKVGDIVELTKKDAMYLCGIKKATMDIIEPEPPKKRGRPPKDDATD